MVPRYGEVALDRVSRVYKHGYASLYEAQEVNDHLGDFQNSEPNEESVKTVSTSKDDAGN